MNDPAFAIRFSPLPGDTWRHFKGAMVHVLGVSQDTENPESRCVVYEHDGQIWHRPLEMFTSRIDRKLYPEANQPHRFELISRQKTAKPAPARIIRLSPLLDALSEYDPDDLYIISPAPITIAECHESADGDYDYTLFCDAGREIDGGRIDAECVTEAIIKIAKEF